MKPRLKRSLLTVARLLGVFALAQRLTRSRLRILCYHGMSIGDQHVLMPFLFMRASTFEGRMRVLQNRRVAVVSLDEGLRRLRQNSITQAETVITIDDGWKTTLTLAAPVLKKYGFPACLYITTEHLASGADVFNVALQYIMWRSTEDRLILDNVHPAVDGVYEFKKTPVPCALAIIQGARNISMEQRQALLQRIARTLNVDLADVLRDGRFGLIDATQARALLDAGIDVQLHSHSHQLPEASFEAVREEIQTNRAIVESMLGGERRHFCYPSGKYGAHHPEWLAALGMISATTCDPGLNDADTPLLLLKRHLDRDDRSDIEFEAEIAGVMELARNAQAWIARLLGRGKTAAATPAHPEVG